MTGATSGSATRLRPPTESLDPRVRRLWRIEIALAGVVLVLVGAAALAVAATAADPPVAILTAALVAVGVLVVAAAIVVPAVAYRAVRFEVTPVGLVVQSGLIVRTLTIVPHSRIQSVNTTTDPLQRALGLATVEVRTASTAVARLAGLDAGRVAHLREDLAAMAGAGDAT